LTIFPIFAARRSLRSLRNVALSNSLSNVTLRSLTRNLALLPVPVALGATVEERANALICPTVGVIRALRSGNCCLHGTQQLAVVNLVLLNTSSVGMTRLIVNNVSVEVRVTREGVTVFVGIIVIEGRVVVAGGNVVEVVSVTETAND
jgi:hypothetical protein